MENTEIIDLIKKISENRDEGAFSQIFDFIAPKINSYFIKNNLNFEQSEELTQDVLSTIWSKAYLFNPEKSKFTTWSWSVAANYLCKIVKYQKVRSKTFADFGLILL